MFVMRSMSFNDHKYTTPRSTPYNATSTQGHYGLGPGILRLYYGINFMTPLSSCLVLIHVVPPLLFTVTPFPATPTNNSQSLTTTS